MSSTNPQPDDQLLSAYLDGELTADERAAVEQRLASDADARQTIEQLRDLRATLANLPAEKADALFTASIMQRIATSSPEQKVDREEDQVAIAGRVGERHSPDESEFTIGRSRRGWAWAAMAIAASLLLMVFMPDDKQQIALQDGKQPEVAGPDSAEAETAAAAERAAPLEIGALKGQPAPMTESVLAVDSLENAPKENIIGDRNQLSENADADSFIPPTAPAPTVSRNMNSRAAAGDSKPTRLSNSQLAAKPSAKLLEMNQFNKSARGIALQADPSDLVVNVVLTPAAYYEGWVDSLLSKAELSDREILARGSEATLQQQKQAKSRDSGPQADRARDAAPQQINSQQPSQLVDIEAGKFAKFLSTLQSNDLKCVSIEVEPTKADKPSKNVVNNDWLFYNRLGTDPKTRSKKSMAEAVSPIEKPNKKIEESSRLRALILVEPATQKARR